MENTIAQPQQAASNLLVLIRFFTAGKRLVFLEKCQRASWLLTDEGMVTAF
jgi:hypothetical protein